MIIEDRAEYEAHKYAVTLLRALYERLPNIADRPALQPAPDLLGILTQIDHLTAIMEYRTEPVTRADVLRLAGDSVDRRDDTYGKPEDNFARIAALWQAFLDNRDSTALTPRDVALMMVLMKTARLQEDQGHGDSWVDIAGYAACGGGIGR